MKKKIKSRAPQAGILPNTLFNLYMSSIPNQIITNANDIAILPSGLHKIQLQTQISSYLNQLKDWLKNRQLNENKSVSTHFTCLPAE